MREERKKRAFIWDEASQSLIENPDYITPPPPATRPAPDVKKDPGMTTKRIKTEPKLKKERKEESEPESSADETDTTTTALQNRHMKDMTPEQAKTASEDDLLSLVDLLVPLAKDDVPISVLPLAARSKLAADIRALLTPSISEQHTGYKTMRRVTGSVPICIASRKYNRRVVLKDSEACGFCNNKSEKRRSFCIRMRTGYGQRPYVVPLPAAERVGLKPSDILYWIKLPDLRR